LILNQDGDGAQAKPYAPQETGGASRSEHR
jgi:hypothetical protein